MKSRTFLLSALALFLMLSLVSAAINLSVVSVPTGQAGQSATVTFRLNNTDATAYTDLVWSDSTGFSQLPTTATLGANEAKDVTAVVAIPSGATGSVSATLVVKSQSNSSAIDSEGVTIPIASSSLSITQSTPINPVQNGTGVLTITNNGNVTLSNIVLSTSGNAALTFSSSSFSLAPGQSTNVNVRITGFTGSSIGTNSITITARDTPTGAQASTSFSVTRTFCEAGRRGSDLEISNIDIETTGDDEDEWRPLDRLIIEVEVANNNDDDDLDDIVVELGLFDNAGNNVADELDFTNKDEEEVEINNIDSDEEETVVFEFQIPGDMDDGSYRLAFKAYSNDLGEDEQCTDVADDLDNDNQYMSISIDREDDEGAFIAFDEVEFSPAEATCGDTVTLTTDVFNIGEDDEERVRVSLFSRELNIDQSEEIRNFDVGDRKQVSFTFTIPQTAADRSYNFELDADYDYDDGEYDQSLDDPETFSFRVFGCGTSQPGNTVPVTISASLESEAVAGEEMVVTSTIRNAGSQPMIAAVDARNYQDWADLTDISDSTVTLSPGESKEVTFRFAVDKDATGENSFVIEVRTANGTQTQEVSVDLEEASTGFDFTGNKWIWIIAIVNIILIIFIIVVAVRIAQR